MAAAQEEAQQTKKAADAAAKDASVRTEELAKSLEANRQQLRADLAAANEKHNAQIADLQGLVQELKDAPERGEASHMPLCKALNFPTSMLLSARLTQPCCTSCILIIL